MLRSTLVPKAVSHILEHPYPNEKSKDLNFLKTTEKRYRLFKTLELQALAKIESSLLNGEKVL